MAILLDRKGDNIILQQLISEVKKKYHASSGEKAIENALYFLINEYPKEEASYYKKINKLEQEKQKYDELIEALNVIKLQL